MLPDLVPLLLVVLLAWTVQAITGFGSTVIALTLGAAFVPIPELLPVMVALNLPLTVWTVGRHRAHVDRVVLVRTILPWMTLGLAVGLAIGPWLGGELLKRGFGAFVLAFAVRDLVQLVRAAPAGPRPGPATVGAWVITAGFFHGLYGSGGPALVQAVGRLGLDRGAFRATLSAVWLAFNVVLLAVFAVQGRLDETALWRIGALLACVPLGIGLGEWLHPRMPERGFRALVQIVLVVGGAALLAG